MLIVVTSVPPERGPRSAKLSRVSCTLSAMSQRSRVCRCVRHKVHACLGSRLWKLSKWHCVAAATFTYWYGGFLSGGMDDEELYAFWAILWHPQGSMACQCLKLLPKSLEPSRSAVCHNFLRLKELTIRRRRTCTGINSPAKRDVLCLCRTTLEKGTLHLKWFLCTVSVQKVFSEEAVQNLSSGTPETP